MSYNVEYMNEAISLALHNIENEGGPFGAIIVKDNTIVGRGANRVTKNNDPTAHAEVMAIRDACKNLNTFDLSGCELYTSCEPCPMCLSAIYWAHLDIIYYGTSKKDAANFGFDDSLIYSELELPKEKRKIQAIEKQRENSLIAFEKWAKKEDKTHY